MILAIATGTGLQKAIEEKIGGFSGHIQLISYSLNASMEQEPISDQQSALDDPNLTKHWLHVQKFGHKAGIIKHKGAFEGVVLKGVQSDYDWSFFQSNLISGTVPIISDDSISSGLLVSNSLASVLNVGLGDTLTMYFFRESSQVPLQRVFYTCGIYNTGLEEFDKTWVVGDFNHIRRLNRWQKDEVGGFEILLNNIKDAPEIAEQLRDHLDFSVDAIPIQEANEQLFQWLRLFDVNILIIIIIVLIVGAINIVVALLILILESTKAIGVLKAIGASNQFIMKTFMARIANIVFQGLLFGNLLGIGIAFFQQKTGLISLNPEIYYVETVPVHIPFYTILLLNLGTALFCTVVLLLPARLIAKVSPAKTLRFQ
jgi:lipoprotein-releasing system permease protein